MKYLISSLLLALPTGAYASNGCPGENLNGVHTSPGSAWSVSIQNKGPATITRIGAGGRATGRATMQCIGETIVIKLRAMSHGLKYDCIGELEGRKLRNSMTCINPDTGSVIGHIRGHDAVISSADVTAGSASQATTSRSNGCPGRVLSATGSSDNVNTWESTAEVSGDIRMRSTHGGPEIIGKSEIHCSGGKVMMFFTQMTHGQEIRCVGTVTGNESLFECSPGGSKNRGWFSG